MYIYIYIYVYVYIYIYIYYTTITIRYIILYWVCHNMMSYLAVQVGVQRRGVARREEEGARGPELRLAGPEVRHHRLGAALFCL